MNDFGSRLKNARIRAGLTQPQLADKLGLINYQSVSQYERQKKPPKFEMIQKMADSLDTTTLYLLGEIDDPSCFIDTEGNAALSKILQLVNDLDVSHLEIVLHAVISKLSGNLCLSGNLTDLVIDCINDEDNADFLRLFSGADDRMRAAVLTILQGQVQTTRNQNAKFGNKKNVHIDMDDGNE